VSAHYRKPVAEMPPGMEMRKRQMPAADAAGIRMDTEPLLLRHLIGFTYGNQSALTATPAGDMMVMSSYRCEC